MPSRSRFRVATREVEGYQLTQPDLLSIMAAAAPVDQAARFGELAAREQFLRLAQARLRGQHGRRGAASPFEYQT